MEHPDLTQHLDQLRKGIKAEYNDIIEDLRDRIKALRQENTSLRQQQQVQSNLIQALSEIQSQLRSTSRPKTSLPEPEKLDRTSVSICVGRSNQSQAHY